MPLRILERRAGIEPANTGFADLRVSRFATGAHGAVVGGQQMLKQTPQLALKIKNPPRLLAGGSSWFKILIRNLAQRTRPRRAALTAAKTHCGSENMGHGVQYRSKANSLPPTGSFRVGPKGKCVKPQDTQTSDFSCRLKNSPPLCRRPLLQTTNEDGPASRPKTGSVPFSDSRRL